MVYFQVANISFKMKKLDTISTIELQNIAEEDRIDMCRTNKISYAPEILYIGSAHSLDRMGKFSMEIGLIIRPFV